MHDSIADAHSMHETFEIKGDEIIISELGFGLCTNIHCVHKQKFNGALTRTRSRFGYRKKNKNKKQIKTVLLHYKKNCFYGLDYGIE